MPALEGWLNREQRGKGRSASFSSSLHHDTSLLAFRVPPYWRGDLTLKIARPDVHHGLPGEEIGFYPETAGPEALAGKVG